MSSSLDSISLRLLDLLQQSVPLIDRPFLSIGKFAGISEREAIERVTVLRGKVIRQISAIFDSRALGYESCLVAAKVDETQIEEAAAIVSGHPGVSHNYQRNHEFNLWYTLAVPPDSRLGLEGTVEILHEHSGAETMRLLPALKLYKIGVKFDLSGEADVTARDSSSTRAAVKASQYAITLRDKRMIRVLQQDLPLIAEPFHLWAQQAGVSTQTLLDSARSYIDAGLMRRFSAVLRHRAAGFSANAMGAWDVPADRRDEFGAIAASFSAVSHCYLRPTYPDWPYSIFTMVHGTKREDCEATLASIARASGQRDYVSLYSSREFKKVRVKYFTDDIARWERECDYSTVISSRSACHAG
jgi:DNA-binding Lrp family transcriptional regulator